MEGPAGGILSVGGLAMGESWYGHPFLVIPAVGFIILTNSVHVTHILDDI